MFQRSEMMTSHPALVAFWDFQEESGTERIAKGLYPYRPVEMAGPIDRIEGGPFGSYAAQVRLGQWWRIPREQCPALDFHGKDAFRFFILRQSH